MQVIQSDSESRQSSGPVADDVSVLLQDCDGLIAAAVKSLEDVFGLVLVPVQRVHQIAQLGEERVRRPNALYVYPALRPKFATRQSNNANSHKQNKPERRSRGYVAAATGPSTPPPRIAASGRRERR